MEKINNLSSVLLQSKSFVGHQNCDHKMPISRIKEIKILHQIITLIQSPVKCTWQEWKEKFHLKWTASPTEQD